MLNQNVVCAILSLTLAITRIRESKSRNDRRQRSSNLSINCFNSVFADINFSTNTQYNIGISNPIVFYQYTFIHLVSIFLFRASAIVTFLSNKNINKRFPRDFPSKVSKIVFEERNEIAVTRSAP